ncbi:hypothetical protein C1645_869752 [Glomus cerebriforme]|uniref:F-box domain-containing protein n=1 Tax=Glomus cerebriforme TaxID=658196 RepID=A0A397TNA9_9GLOM|nr:hypothetical protein C1645_869752 [Glomus cerebriforme]
MSQLNSDCFSEIFEHIDDKVTLHSCLLVNRHWCKILVKILWRDVWNYNTLITCLPKESKEILYEKGIIISTSTPIFNYVTYCKILSDYHIKNGIERLLKNQQNILSSSSSLNNDNNNNNNNNNNIYNIIANEIYKMFMKQSSLKILGFESHFQNINFTSYPGAFECLKNLTDLHCRSNIYSEFFYHLSQICQNIQLLSIEFEMKISNGLLELISVQKNLKYLELNIWEYFEDLIPLLFNLPNTLIKLELNGGENLSIPLLFIEKFINLRELVLSLDGFLDFDKFQYSTTFPNLQILKFKCACPSYDLLIKFLENNGKNLRELYVDIVYDFSDDDNSLNLIIAKFCPNIRKFSSIYLYDLETLKDIFNNCQYLESLRINCDRCSNRKLLFDFIVKYSPKNFFELKLYDNPDIIKSNQEISLCFHCGEEDFPYHHCNEEDDDNNNNNNSNTNYYDLESESQEAAYEFFFKSWANRIPQKPISLIITTDYDLTENMKILIEKYSKLGVIKDFMISNNYYDDDDDDFYF